MSLKRIRSPLYRRVLWLYINHQIACLSVYTYCLNIHYPTRSTSSISFSNRCKYTVLLKMHFHSLTYSCDNLTQIYKTALLHNISDEIYTRPRTISSSSLISKKASRQVFSINNIRCLFSLRVDCY